MSNYPCGYSEPPLWEDYFDAQDDAIKDYVKEIELKLTDADKRIEELEKKLIEQRDYCETVSLRYEEKLKRYGNPFIHSIVQERDGYDVVLQIIDTAPAENGLHVRVA